MTNTFRVKSKVGRKQQNYKVRTVSRLRGLKNFEVEAVEGDKIKFRRKK